MKYLLLIILPLISACTATGHSVGVTHAIDSNGEMLYNAPLFTRESEKVDIGVQYYYFDDRTEIDVLEVDWNYKF